MIRMSNSLDSREVQTVCKGYKQTTLVGKELTCTDSSAKQGSGS